MLFQLCAVLSRVEFFMLFLSDSLFIVSTLPLLSSYWLHVKHLTSQWCGLTKLIYVELISMYFVSTTLSQFRLQALVSTVRCKVKSFSCFCIVWVKPANYETGFHQQSTYRFLSLSNSFVLVLSAKFFWFDSWF